MKVILKESQIKLINEAFQNNFSFEMLSSIGINVGIEEGNKMRYEYCIKYLGEPVGEGSSRVVFTLSDNYVLKLAYKNPYCFGVGDGAGEEQNKREYRIYKETETPLLAKILYCDKNYFFMVCENVVPAEEVDFEKILGIPFSRTWVQNSQKEPRSDGKKGDTTIGFNKYFDNIKGHEEEYQGETLYDILSYIEYSYAMDEPGYDEEIEEIISNSEWLMDLVEFVSWTGTTDFCSVENFGIVNRDGKPAIVLIDTGLDLETWNNNYDYV